MSEIEVCTANGGDSELRLLFRHTGRPKSFLSFPSFVSFGLEHVYESGMSDNNGKCTKW